ncbi:MAG: 2'-5' RNA ligase family protein [Ilumatobacter sp.]|uniref:2'-5' RNA ligase family protein n=1 Tax=Ilumatobacter sp. TaxID=1967498 RepID=UPI00262AEEEA|nr:2'-5' RNA ligase family protein [Ilumatobacter sp.]MDJ0771171.1 2'-5' RNA ligase family protein [Ilumatobacter sp.]
MPGSRAFVGVFPPPPVVAELDAIGRWPGPRWVPAQQLHVTLRFLGDDVDVDAVERQLVERFRGSRASVALGPAVEQLGRHVICVPAGGLDALAGSIDEALDELVGPRDRPFVGHLTLGRIRRGGGRPSPIGEPIELSWIAHTVRLVVSELSPDGARYVDIAELPLDGPTTA